MTAIRGDARVVLAAQAVRAFGYGLTSVLLGVTLDELGFSGFEAGIVIAAVVAGTAAGSFSVWRQRRGATSVEDVPARRPIVRAWQFAESVRQWRLDRRPRRARS